MNKANSRTQHRTANAKPMASGIFQRKCAACGQHTIASGECEGCSKKRLQRSAASQADPMEVPPTVHEVLRSPGQPLDPATRSVMESHFGYNFSQVPVHSDGQLEPGNASSSLLDADADQAFERASQLSSGVDLSNVFTAVNQVAGTGHPLNQSTREFMQARFGHDFSSVRLHSDSRAINAARLVNAEAFTVGEHVFLSTSDASFSSAGDRTLLAHELVHVLQQRQASAQSTSVMDYEFVDGGASEREADNLATRLVSGHTSMHDNHHLGSEAITTTMGPSPVRVSAVPKTTQYAQKPGESFRECVDNRLSSLGILSSITGLVWATCAIIGGFGALGGTLIEPGGGTLTGLGLALAGCLSLGAGIEVGKVIGALAFCAE
jgi:Domain of unknown function (DUF4157)